MDIMHKKSIFVLGWYNESCESGMLNDYPKTFRLFGRFETKMRWRTYSLHNMASQLRSLNSTPATLKFIFPALYRK